MADPRGRGFNRGKGPWHEPNPYEQRRRWANDPFRHGWDFYKYGDEHKQPIYHLGGRVLAYFAGPWMGQDVVAWWVIGEGEDEGVVYPYPEYDIQKITAGLKEQ